MKLDRQMNRASEKTMGNTKDIMLWPLQKGFRSEYEHTENHGKTD